MRTPWWVVNEADVVSTVIESGKLCLRAAEQREGQKLGAFYQFPSNAADSTTR